MSSMKRTSRHRSSSELQQRRDVARERRAAQDRVQLHGREPGREGRVDSGDDPFDRASARELAESRGIERVERHVDARETPRARSAASAREARAVRRHRDVVDPRVRREALHERDHARPEQRLTAGHLDARDREPPDGPAHRGREPVQRREVPLVRSALEPGPAVATEQVAPLRHRDAQRDGSAPCRAVPRTHAPHGFPQRTAFRIAASISFWMSPGICMFFMNAQSQRPGSRAHPPHLLEEHRRRWRRPFFMTTISIGKAAAWSRPGNGLAAVARFSPAMPRAGPRLRVVTPTTQTPSEAL